MQIHHASEQDITTALQDANQHYEGNLEFRPSAYQTPSFAQRGNSFLVTLGVANARGPGHRIGFSHLFRVDAKPKRLRYACWHAHRDFLAALFKRVPGARVKSALADYRGAAAFARLFPNTADKQVTGMGHTILDVCECEVDPIEGDVHYATPLTA